MIRFSIILFFISSCGVKTAPRSDIIESLPAIPFKEFVDAENETVNDEGNTHVSQPK